MVYMYHFHLRLTCIGMTPAKPQAASASPGRAPEGCRSPCTTPGSLLYFQRSLFRAGWEEVSAGNKRTSPLALPVPPQAVAVGRARPQRAPWAWHTSPSALAPVLFLFLPSVCVHPWWITWWHRPWSGSRWQGSRPPICVLMVLRVLGHQGCTDIGLWGLRTFQGSLTSSLDTGEKFQKNPAVRGSEPLCVRMYPLQGTLMELPLSNRHLSWPPHLPALLWVACSCTCSHCPCGAEQCPPKSTSTQNRRMWPNIFSNGLCRYD